MRRIAAILVLSAKALAQIPIDQGVTFSFASANGGAKTLVSWTFTGNWASAQGWSWQGGGSTSMVGVGVGWNLPVSSPIFSSVADRDFTAAVDNSVFSVTNLATSQVSSGTVLHIASNTGTYAGENFYFLVNLNVTAGDAIRINPASGSAVVDIAFSQFNPGAFQQVTYGSFQGSGSVAGGAVPEPSTYGLALAGLALAGAVARRRSKRG